MIENNPIKDNAPKPKFSYRNILYKIIVILFVSMYFLESSFDFNMVEIVILIALILVIIFEIIKFFERFGKMRKNLGKDDEVNKDDEPVDFYKGNDVFGLK